MPIRKRADVHSSQYTREGTWKVGQFDGMHTLRFTNGEVRMHFYLDNELIANEVLK